MKHAQMEHWMETAIKEVQDKGLEASDRAVLLTGFWWLNKQMQAQNKPQGSLVIYIPKRVIAAISAALAAVTGGVAGIGKATGWW